MTSSQAELIRRGPARPGAVLEPRPQLGRPLLAMAALAVGLLLTELDQSVFAAALPTMVGELGGLSLQLWVGTGYVLAGTVMMPLLGRLGDVLGRRTVFTAALGVFVLGSVLGALAPTMPTVVAARIVQGVGGGGLFVLVEAAIADLVAPRRRPLVLSGIGAVFALAAVTGPILGGTLTETVGWRWAFWLNVPLGAAAALAAWRWLPTSRAKAGVRLDLAGFGCLVTAVTGAVLLIVWGGGRIAWTSVTALGLMAATGLAVVGLVAAERRAEQPILPPSLLRRPDTVLALGAGSGLAAAMFGTVTYLPTYLQVVRGLRPAAAGFFMLTLVGSLGAATVITGLVVGRTGRLVVFPLVGTVLVGAGLLAMTRWQPATSTFVLAGTLVLLGAGIGCAWGVLVVLVQESAPKAELGVATAANGFFREIGVVLGTAIVGRLFTTGVEHQLSAIGGGTAPRTAVALAYNDAFTAAVSWLVPILLVAAGALVALVLLRRSSPSVGGSR